MSKDKNGRNAKKPKDAAKAKVKKEKKALNENGGITGNWRARLSSAFTWFDAHCSGAKSSKTLLFWGKFRLHFFSELCCQRIWRSRQSEATFSLWIRWQNLHTRCDHGHALQWLAFTASRLERSVESEMEEARTSHSGRWEWMCFSCLWSSFNLGWRFSYNPDRLIQNHLSGCR